jgi:hypothetical protein
MVEQTRQLHMSAFFPGSFAIKFWPTWVSLQLFHTAIPKNILFSFYRCSQWKILSESHILFSFHFYWHMLVAQCISLWYFHTCIQCTPIKFIPFVTPSHPPSSLLKNFNRFHCSIFIHVCSILTVITPLTFSLYSPPSAVTHPQTDSVLHSCHSF